MDKLTQAIESIKAGDKARARQLLSETLQTEPRNEQAWLWMSGAVDDPSQQSYCLEQVLKINPANQQAAASLAKLKSLEGAQIAGVTDAGQVKTGGEPGPQNKPLPIPELSFWPRDFAGWGVWSEFAVPGDGSTGQPREMGLGLLIAESRYATERSIGWAGGFAAAAVVFAVIAYFNLRFPSTAVVFGIFSVLFVGLALYRGAAWYLNNDLKVEIFREGFTFTHKGETQKVYWREVARVREQWMKQSYEGVIQINTHKVEVHKADGKRLDMDRKVKDIERIGRLIQLAVADHLLPACLERLNGGGTCDFGAFSLSRDGLTHKDKKFLPWREVKSLTVQTMGQTLIQVYKTGGKLSLAWATVNGGAVDNQHLFLTLAYWFIGAAQQPAAVAWADAPAGKDEPFDGNVKYKLSVSKREAQVGVQKVLYVGLPRQERRLVVQVQPGTKSGAVYRYPEHGLHHPTGGAPGELTVEVAVGKGRDPADWEATQITIGFVILILGMMWLSLWSTLDLVTSAFLAALIGAVGGVLIAVNRRVLGAVCGAIGGVVSFGLQTLYYIFMYLTFGREEFWNYETAIVMFVSFLPGIGLYWLLTRKSAKKTGRPLPG